MKDDHNSRKQYRTGYDETGSTRASLGGRGNFEFASDTASASGESKAQVNKHLARAEALGDDLDEVAGFLEYEREQARKRMGSGVNQHSPVENLPQGSGKARDKAGSRMGGGA